MPHPTRRAFMLSTLAFSTLALTACGQREPEVSRGGYNPPLFPNETPELRQLINKWADTYQIPRELVHRQAIRESTHRPEARNGPYYGLLQILPQTARTMGHDGPPSELLDPNVNLKYAGKYLRGAYIVADGDVDTAMKWYAKGYYYEAKKKGLLYETGLRSQSARQRNGRNDPVAPSATAISDSISASSRSSGVFGHTAPRMAQPASRNTRLAAMNSGLSPSIVSPSVAISQARSNRTHFSAVHSGEIACAVPGIISMHKSQKRIL